MNPDQMGHTRYNILGMHHTIHFFLFFLFFLMYGMCWSFQSRSAFFGILIEPTFQGIN